jgi:hypothetical protein
VWRAAGALHGVLVATVVSAFVSAVSGCKNDESPGVYLEFRADSAAFRPEAIRFTWMRAGAELVNARLPEVGSFAGSDPILGSIFIETDGPLIEPRLLAVKGLRGDTEALTGQLVSGAAVVVPASTDPVQRWAVMLEQPLADTDGDGRPDVVHRCLSERWPACLDAVGPAPPPPDDGGAVDAAPDGGTPADTAAPADAEVVALNQGLVGHWRLDEGMGTQARDSSGANNHGTLRMLPASAWMPGKNGTGLEIPATEGGAVFVPDSDSIDSPRGAFTLAAWTFRMRHRQSYATVLSRRYATGGSEHYLLGFQNGNLRALVNTYLPDDSEAELTGPAQAPLFTWVHVALTHDGTTLRLYQDGNEVASTPYARPQMPDTTPICIGCNQNGPGDSANDETLAGRLDEVMLYSRALSAAEVARLAAGDLPSGM